MEDANPRAVLGANKPPLDDADDLAARLELRHADLIDRAAALEMERFGLPQEPATDEECGEITNFVAKAGKVARDLEKARTEDGKPYLLAQRKINEIFKELTDPIAAMTGPLEARIKVYAKAKAAREQAERLAKQREEEAKAAEARAEERRKREEADRAAREADEAAAKIRAAKTAEDRKAAEAEMREKETEAQTLRDSAEDSAGEAAKAERSAERNERAATSTGTALSRVHGETATSSVSKVWTPYIVDLAALKKSLGVLGPYFSENELSSIVGRVVRAQSHGGQTPTIQIPGVEIRADDKVNISARRGA